jgi:hypothetical protein
MTVSLTYNITQVPVSDGTFTATFEVIDAVDISRAIFVFDSGTLEFTGVATIYDMRTWPAERDTDYMSFRALLLTKSYPTLDEASAFVAYTRGRIESLRAAWQTYLDSFVETITVVTPES